VTTVDSCAGSAYHACHMSDDQDEVRDSADLDETVLDHEGSSADAETEFHPFDEVADAYEPAIAERVIGPDGLPVTMDQTTESDIPALSTESLVCMGDYSAFVIRNSWAEVLVRFTPAQVTRAPNGRWRTRREVFEEICRAQNPEKSRELQQFALSMSWSDTDWVEVEPIRPPCRHYVRQKGSFHLNASRTKYYRLCSARRSTEGTFMTVSDTGMWACDMRDPYDATTSQQLEDFDKLKVEQGKTREHLPIFGGIFDTKGPTDA